MRYSTLCVQPLYRSLSIMDKTRKSLFDIDQAAKLTGYSRERLHGAVDSGTLSTTEEAEEGGGVRISGIELERWMSTIEGKAVTLSPRTMDFEPHAGEEAHADQDTADEHEG